MRIIFMSLFCMALLIASKEGDARSRIISVPDSSAVLQEDSIPTVHFFIAKNYLCDIDSDIEISQFLTDSTPLSAFSERVMYDKNVVQLVGVQNGAETPLPSWTIQKAVTTQGQVQIIAASTGLPIQKPGEIVQFYFHVLSSAELFDVSFFSDTISSVIGPDSSYNIVSDTGQLMVIDNCIPIMSSSGVPSGIALRVQNPSSGISILSYFLPDDAPSVHFSLFNSAGCRVKECDPPDPTTGWHTMDWNVSGLGSGIYTVELQAAEHRVFQRVIVLP